MYDWLNELPGDGSAHVVTPTRRLARMLRAAHAKFRLAAGESAWASPAIFALQDWYVALAERRLPTDTFPVRVNEQQARLLWEESLRAEIVDPFVNPVALARLCRDTWQRLQDWRVPLTRVQTSATGPDQQLFARAAGRYAESLAARGFVDGAGLPHVLLDRIAQGRLAPPAAVWCCGFDRLPPQAGELLAAMAARGTRRRELAPAGPGRVGLLEYPDPEAELRAAGAWAREELERDPSATLAIVVTRLEQDARRSAALIREGLVPGWQAAGPAVAAALDLSWGGRLADLPAIHIALLALRWCHRPLTGAEVGMLLRSPFLGTGDGTGRSRLERRLRDWPDRPWQLNSLLGALGGRDGSPDAVDWLARFAGALDALRATPSVQAPAAWAEQFERRLAVLGWPGEAPLDSADFQLDNRWRKLLNEFARLGLVAPRLRGEEAVARLAALAADTLFQPETPGAVVAVLGPLEAAGLEFDKLRLTGAVATDWPSPSRPLTLVARELQREYGMPDATPEDTASFARRVLRRLAGSAAECTLTYPRRVGDAEQSPTRLLGGLAAAAGVGDPGWYAMRFAGSGEFEVPGDRVPPVAAGERISGGATTIQRQGEEPFAAFALGRLQARPLPAFTGGIPPNVRGNLIHAALAALYAERPVQAALRGWSADDRSRRIGAAVDRAYYRAERHADPVLRELFRLERERTASLLRDVLDLDLERDPFAVGSVEGRNPARFGRLNVELRCDRIDVLPDGSEVILDYKTGRPPRLVGRDGPSDWQLIVYACAATAPVSGLGLYVVDRRATHIDGTGPAFGDDEHWYAGLAEWRATVFRLAAMLADGDVRLNAARGLGAARPLAVLSRFPEVYRGD